MKLVSLQKSLKLAIFAENRQLRVEETWILVLTRPALKQLISSRNLARSSVKVLISRKRIGHVTDMTS